MQKLKVHNMNSMFPCFLLVSTYYLEEPKQNGQVSGFL